MAKFKYYNANINDEDINDCSKRALSLAFNLSYNDVEKELVSIRDDLGKRYYNSPEVINKFITNHNAIELPEAKSTIVQDFCDTHSIGTYLLEVYKIGEPAHITCLIDNTVYDTWECLDWKIIKAFQVSNEVSKINSDLRLSDYKKFIESQTKITLKTYIEEYIPRAKFNFVAADYFNDTTEKVRFTIDLINYGKRNFNDSFLIKVSYRDTDVENTIKDTIQLKCLKSIKKIKKMVNNDSNM